MNPTRSEEIFDVVDEADRVIGAEPRAVVHARKLRHRAVHVLLADREGRVFLQLRSPHKDQAPNRWDSSCSGHLDSGEDYDEAAYREVGEELGVRLPPGSLRRILKLDAGPQTGNEFVWIYEGRHDGPFILHPEEISDGRFLAPAEIDRAILERPHEFSRAFAHVWDRARHRFPGGAGAGRTH
jgi:isopentenyldiphosphate isomerase